MNPLLLAAGTDMMLVLLMVTGPLIALYGVMQLQRTIRRVGTVER